MLRCNCNLKTHVQNLWYPLPLQIGGPKTTFFGRLRNLTATLTACIFRMKRDIENRLSALTITRDLLHLLQCHELWSTNGLKLDLHFCPSPPPHKFCILNCQASQTEISKRNSTTLCQTVDGRSR